MRKSKIDLLLAGAVLTLAVAAPAFAAAAQDRAESVVPLPPALDVQMQRHPAIRAGARAGHPPGRRRAASSRRPRGRHQGHDR